MNDAAKEARKKLVRPKGKPRKPKTPEEKAQDLTEYRPRFTYDDWTKGNNPRGD